MTPCTPAPPCDLEYPLFCEPRELTAIAKRLVVEDSSACDKTLQTPPSGQVLISNANGTISWTNGANDTLLRKNSTGSVEFATLNSILQAGPVDLGNQPLTTTGALTVGSLSPTLAITASSLTVSGATSTGSLSVSGATSTAAITSSSTILANGNSSKIGYDFGAGGIVNQVPGAKTNPVTLNRPTGIIATDTAALAANTAVTFILNNSLIESTDIVLISHEFGGTLGSYNFATSPSAGTANIVIRNITSGSLSESLRLRFIVIKSANG